MQLAVDTREGAPGTDNEDYVVAAPNLLIVLDGATVRTDTGCRHGVTWYVRKLGTALISTADEASDLQTALSNAIRNVATLHPECDLSHPGTPSAAAAIVRIEDEYVRYLVLGDIYVVVDAGDKSPLVVTDNRVDATATEARDEADKWPIGSPEKREALIAMKHGELAARNVAGGYWISAADPTVTTHAITGTIARTNIRRIAMLSDGAARLVTLFQRYTWSDVLDTLVRNGPADLLNHVRSLEDSDPMGETYPRNKKSDDASILVVSTEANQPTPTPSTDAAEHENPVVVSMRAGRLFGACPTVDGRIL